MSAERDALAEILEEVAQVCNRDADAIYGDARHRSAT